MAQLRQDYEAFTERGSEIIVIGPEKVPEFKEYFEKEQLPFVGLPDPDHKVLKLYGQEVNLFKLGRLPAQILIDQEGMVRFIHYGHDMTDIPANDELLSLLDQLNKE